ncbi:PTS system cellobiose-specific IIA component [Enterococcus sp. PF1-24]|uniref:PTS lactose/cellobiose transporter subunit IIA n=1 Tax=unclassified Enterococcus TaxID=2608891 RepID=UPI002476285F|nr:MULTISPECIES: PTS lactose/cellobiose transporter subunit IIA [unclassified Enterococcus]MDH6364327.1 PTS system cellobiose-specific IIA component [Enterococcus sp. PFB1-1]MDH6401484.1 PTS system cellobiose-specific IIA component [Enterococcus sp. PF1-24]
MEEVIMEIILNAGNARSKSLLAIKEAQKGAYEKADELLNEAKIAANLAHKSQTALITEEVSGNTQVVSLLMVHAQDHLMTALAVRDLAIEMISYGKNLEEKIRVLEGKMEK